LPIIVPHLNPVNFDVRVELRKKLDEELDSLPSFSGLATIRKYHSWYPAKKMDGTWHVYELDDGRSVYYHEDGSYTIVTLDNDRAHCADTPALLKVISAAPLDTTLDLDCK